MTHRVTPATRAQEEHTGGIHMLDTTRDVVRKSLLAMLGAITLADDELEQLLDRLAARGEQAARERFNHIEALRNRLTGSEGAILEGALLRQTLQEEIERQGRLLAAALDLPTRDSINLLREQIEQISTMLNQIVAQHTPVTTPTDNGQAPAPAPATPVPQQAVETPAPAAVQPEAVETPAPAAVQPEAVETPAPAAVQPEAVETPALPQSNRKRSRPPRLPLSPNRSWVSRPHLPLPLNRSWVSRPRLPQSNRKQSRPPRLPLSPNWSWVSRPHPR
jgi:hypothetical protein